MLLLLMLGATPAVANVGTDSGSNLPTGTVTSLWVAGLVGFTRTRAARDDFAVSKKLRDKAWTRIEAKICNILTESWPLSSSKQ